MYAAFPFLMEIYAKKGASNEEGDIKHMTNAEYDSLKKQEYLSVLDIEAMDDNIPEDVKQEWLARLNQIKSGHLLKLTHQQIDMYCALQGYDKREFVKSCVYEGVSDDILANIIQCDDIEAMKKLKREHYKSDYIMQGINNKVNSLYGALDDCEQKFGVFEEYLKQFAEQVKNKDAEIGSLKTELGEYRKKIEKLQEENNGLKLRNSEIKAQYEQNAVSNIPKEIVVTRIIKEETAKPAMNNVSLVNISEDKPKKKKTLLSGVKQLLNKNIKLVEDTDKETETSDEPTHNIDDGNDALVGSKTQVAVPTTKKYKREQDVVTVGDIESYILNANLTSEQLHEISKCITMDIEDEQIIMMIENNLSPSQIKNSANIIMAKRNANQRKIDQMKSDMSKAAGMIEAPAKMDKPADKPKSLADSFVDDDDDDMEEFAEEDEMEVMED